MKKTGKWILYLLIIMLMLSMIAAAEEDDVYAVSSELQNNAADADSGINTDKIVIPKGVSSLEEEAFYDCRNITAVILPKNLTYIGRDAFKGCSNLEEVYYEGNIDDAQNIAIDAGNDSLIFANWHYNYPEEKTFNLTLAHNLAEDHAVHIALLSWSEAIKKASNGSIDIDVVPNGVFGFENDCISQIQAGQLEMTKVSAANLSNFNSTWNCLSVPYVFSGRDHLYNVMNSEIADDLYALTEGDGFVGITWFESGIRSFYTKDIAIRTPADLKGLKLRTMTNDMTIAMMDAFGASSMPMGYGEIYTAMQTGVIDGADNNVTALRDHMDVTRYYCYDEHNMIPDVIVISSEVWNEMSAEQQEIMKSTALDMTAYYRQLWTAFEQKVIDMAAAQGVEFVTDVDKASFRAAVQPIYDNLANTNPNVYGFVERIEAMREK